MITSQLLFKKIYYNKKGQYYLKKNKKKTVRCIEHKEFYKNTIFRTAWIASRDQLKTELNNLKTSLEG